MANDSPLETLLMEMGIDLSPVQKAGEQIKSILNDLNTASDQNINKTKEQVSAQTSNLTQMRQMATDAVSSAIKAISVEKEKQAVLEKETAEYKRQVAAQEILNAETQKLALREAAIEAHLKTQTAEIQKQIAEKRKERLEESEHHERSQGARIATKLGGAIFGSGVGGVIGAITGGELLAHGIEQGVEGLARFIEKLKEASVESGKLSQVMDRLDKLAAGVGIDAGKFLDKLSESTEGLVDRFTLAQFATRALQSGIKGLTPEKITEVTEAVVKLAESSGHTAKEAVDRLGSALYRGGARAGAMLAQVTGLTRTQLQLANLSPLLNRTERDVASLNHTFAVLISEAAKLGEVPRTLDQAIEQVHVLSKDLFTSFGRGFNESQGTQIFLEMVAKITRGLESLTTKAEEFGRRFGDSLVTLMPVLTIVQQALGQVFTAVGEIIKEIGRISQSTDKDEMLAGIRAIGNALIFLKTPVDALVAGFALMAKSALAVAEVTMPVLGAATGYRGVKEVPQAFREYVAAAKTSGDQQQALYSEFNTAMDRMAKKGEVKAPIRPATSGGENTKEQVAQIAADRAFEEALLRQRKSFDALELEEKQSAINEAKKLDEDAYHSGEVTLQQHLTAQKDYAKDSYQAQLQLLNNDLEAKKQELEARARQIDEQVKLGRVFPSVGKEQKTALAIDLETSINEAAKKGGAAWSKYLRDIAQIDKQGETDRLAERRKGIADVLSATQEAVKAEEALNKQYLDNGRITADQYVEAQIASITKIAEARKQASDDTIAAAKENSKLTPALLRGEQDAVTKAIQEAREKLTALQEQVTGLRLGDITRAFGSGNKGLETQIGIQQSQPGVGFSTATASLIQSLQKNLQNKMSQLVALANTPEAQANPDTWFKIYEQIQHITQEQLKWNQALKEQLDMSRQLGSGLESIGTGIASNFHSKFAQNLASNVQAGAKSLQDSFKLGDTLRGVGQTPDQKIQQTANVFATAGSRVQQAFMSVSDAAQKASDYLTNLASPIGSGEAGVEGHNLPGGQSGDFGGEVTGGSGDKSKSPGGSLQTFATKMGAAINAVDNFTSSILHSKNALTGAAGGAGGGAGLGNTVSSALGMTGPWGMIAGAGVGALLGGIVGQKNAQVTSNITGFENQYKSLMNQFALNTNNLNNTITQLAGLVAQIQVMQSNSKKGSSQYQQLIDQYNQQIAQLEQQQNQILVNMKEMAAVTSAPLGQQSALGGIQSIIQQYEQYAGAIQSVNQLMAQGQTYQQATTNVTQQQAAAYQYLTGAVQAYSNSLALQLNQDEQTAINDALQLNDLLYQRQQMMLQYNDQVESVLSAGVLTRQMTRAQTAGQKIQELNVQYQMQMDRINEEIAADQYKVSIETQIFNLAQTRIGLENQLLTAQNYQTQQSLVQISALQKLVTQIQSGDWASGALGQLLGAIPTVTNGGTTLTPLQILMALLMGNSSIGGTQSNATQSLDELFSRAYENRASMGFGTFRATNL